MVFGFRPESRSSSTGFPNIDRVLSRIEKYYRTKQEPKPSGGVRTFEIPMGFLHVLQGKIYQTILDPVPLPACVHGGVLGKSIRTNAAGHVGRPLLLAMDIKNCFPSITPMHVNSVFERLGYVGQAGKILTALTTYKFHLPQGPRTSPKIASLVLARIDARLAGIERKHPVHYTRYGDDMNLSGGERVKAIRSLAARAVKEDAFQIKQGPLGQLMPNSSRQEITKTSVNWKQNVPREKRKLIMEGAALAFSTGKELTPTQIGQLSYLRSVNKSVARRLGKAARAQQSEDSKR
jgi:RNA-directed DNA polymerase